MSTLRSNTALALFALLFAACLSSQASAETVIKFDLADFSTGPDFAFTLGSLATADDGDGTTTGDQSTDVKYQGFLSDLTSITSGASLTLAGINVDGSASGGTGLITQVTTGGSFSLYDNTNMLLLSGDLGGGVIAGSSVSTSGGFFSTSPILYTGGSLLSRVQPDSGRISLSFTDVQSGGSAGLRVDNGTLLNFTATATGQFEAQAVPEPSVIGMAAIGTVAMICHRRRRRRAAKTAQA